MNTKTQDTVKIHITAYFLGLVQSLHGLRNVGIQPYVCAVYQVIVMKALEYYGFYNTMYIHVAIS